MAWQPINVVLAEQLVRRVTLTFAYPQHDVSDVWLIFAAASQEIVTEDRQHMQHALTLAKKGLSKTYPNPAVGCVIVQRGKVQSISL